MVTLCVKNIILTLVHLLVLISGVPRIFFSEGGFNKFS